MEIRLRCSRNFGGFLLVKQRRHRNETDSETECLRLVGNTRSSPALKANSSSSLVDSTKLKPSIV